jgi:hypothetical protein
VTTHGRALTLDQAKGKVRDNWTKAQDGRLKAGPPRSSDRAIVASLIVTAM